MWLLSGIASTRLSLGGQMSVDYVFSVDISTVAMCKQLTTFGRDKDDSVVRRRRLLHRRSLRNDGRNFTAGIRDRRSTAHVDRAEVGETTTVCCCSVFECTVLCAFLITTLRCLACNISIDSTACHIEHREIYRNESNLL